ncbi:chitin deacetylase [Lunasporangiospora selenospora]|uniref:Chitin deacetylase n=1 Tax=Lunasporangiospora selenospora TaxID=979761 RepID=A0A9P6G1K0_9FUNG|nr:chitin deacetylase [Lunasporangiospora selenospora]
MVKLFTSIAIVAVSIAVARAQSTGPLDASKYPRPDAVPPTNSPEVQAWLKEIDLTGAPSLPLNKNEECSPKPVPNECRWTCDGCAGEDVTHCGRANTWGLTFDDGPTAATSGLLDFLKTKNHKASFFLIGGNVLALPDVVRREVAEGHHLASHTWSHKPLTSLSNEQIVAEMKWTEKAVMDATGLRLKYMRPPYGDVNNRVRFVLKKLGYIIVDWTGDEFDTNDWKLPTITEGDVVKRITTSLDAYVKTNKTQGFYCLEHDLSELTVNAAKKLIPLGDARNITIAPIPLCENDLPGYQSGSTAPLPSNSPSSSTLPTGSSTGGTSPTTSGTTPTVSTAGKTSAGARGQILTMSGAIAAVAMAAALLA